jgi:hypothetical protein
VRRQRGSSSTFPRGCLQKKYYDDSHKNMVRQLAEMRDNGCDFIVAGRALGGKKFEVSQLTQPQSVVDLS